MRSRPDSSSRRITSRVSTAIACVASPVGGAWYRARMHPYFDVPVPTVIGHRGASGELPENTIAAFGHAVADGAAILETDVHITRDGALVLIHDEMLERTTNGRGRVGDHTLAELRALDAGFQFSRV